MMSVGIANQASDGSGYSHPNAHGAPMSIVRGSTLVLYHVSIDLTGAARARARVQLPRDGSQLISVTIPPATSFHSPESIQRGVLPAQPSEADSTCHRPSRFRNC